MTPIAHQMARESSTNKEFRELTTDIHCFDMTEVFDAAFELSVEYLKRGVYDNRLCFLPARRTWLEWHGYNSRYWPACAEKMAEGTGYIFTGIGELFTEDDEAIYKRTVLRTHDNQLVYGNLGKIFRYPKHLPLKSDKDDAATIWAMLAFINHPKIIGRKQHMPHRGLERRLIQKFGVGKFPLHAWTEIKLHVTPTYDARQDPSVEAHYTGERAYHFCRAHLRLRNGKLEFVSSHWRGDPALGIKQSRYKVVT